MPQAPVAPILLVTPLHDAHSTPPTLPTLAKLDQMCAEAKEDRAEACRYYELCGTDIAGTVARETDRELRTLNYMLTQVERLLAAE